MKTEPQATQKTEPKTDHRTAQKVEKISLKIGPYQIVPLLTGQFGLDGGAMFGTVPKVLWERTNPADSSNRILMEARALLLKSPDRNILIDCGNGADFELKYGEKLGAKFAEMFNINPDGPNLLKSLSEHGLAADDIHEVIITHLHFDHVGGGVHAQGNRLVPTFMNARYTIQRANLTTASHPNLRERSSYYASNFQPLIDHQVLHVVDGPQTNYLPGVSLFISNGHTEGQQIVKISDGKISLLYAADLVPTSTHVRTAWLMGYDLNPVLLMEEKQKYLSMVADEKSYLFFEHDPYCDAALVQKVGSDFQVSQRFWL